jgi:hypothetical protein
MGLRDKMRRLERAAEGEVVVYMCEECSEEFRARLGVTSRQLAV